MKVYKTILALVATARLTSAHATVFAAWINGVDQGLGNSASGYIRSPPNNSPVMDVQSSDMTCNVNGRNTVARTLQVKAGDKFTFEWHHNNRDANDDIIADSHKGPILVYIAPTAAGTAGKNWVKIYEDGYDPATKLWAVDKLIRDKGLHSITIPNIVTGDYLLRAEIIALHEGNRQGGAQFYMECVQVRISANSNANSLPQGVSIPGTYSANDPGIYFNLYSGNIQSYPIPGPSVWNGAGVSGSGTSSTSQSGTPTSSSSSPLTSSTSISPSTSPKPPTTSSSSTTGLSTFSTSTVRLTSSTISTTAAPTPTPIPSQDSCQGGDVAQWQQCGGINYSGPTRCKNGLICKEWNPYYFQCIMP